MKEFIEKLIGRLEEQAEQYRRRGFEHEEKGNSAMADKYYGKQCSYLHSIEIVNQLAEEHNGGWIEELLEAKKNCGEDSDCSDCPFGQIKDRCILAELQMENTNRWIPCSDRLPEDGTSMRVWLSFTNPVASYVKRAWWCDNHFEWDNGQTLKEIPLAWMPSVAPEPYKEKEEVPIEM